MALENPRLAVVGGGLTGLAAAWRLRTLRPGARIDVWEASQRWGGKLITLSHGELVWEGAADGFLIRKPPALDWIRELGLEERLIEPRPEHRFSHIWHAGRLHPLPEGFSGLVPLKPEGLLGSSLLTEQGARRGAREAAVPPKTDDHEESVREFFVRRFGDEVFDRILEPLLAGIYAGDASRLAVDATFPALVALERSGQSLTTGLSAPSDSSPAFRSFASGMEEWPRALASRLVGAGVSLLSGRTVVQVTRNRSWVVKDSAGREEGYDGVILAVGPRAAGALIASEGSAAKVLREWPTSSVASVSLAYQPLRGWSPPAGSGFVVPPSEGLPFSAVTWSSQKWPYRAPEGALVARVYFGGARRPDDWSRPDSELTSEALRALEPWTRGAQNPDAVRVFRWRDAFAQPNLGHRERWAALESGLPPGLALAGGYRTGAGLPDCLASAETAARELDRFLLKGETEL